MSKYKLTEEDMLSAKNQAAYVTKSAIHELLSQWENKEYQHPDKERQVAIMKYALKLPEGINDQN